MQIKHMYRDMLKTEKYLNESMNTTLLRRNRHIFIFKIFIAFAPTGSTVGAFHQILKTGTICGASFR